jgi:hypothetical protein
MNVLGHNGTSLSQYSNHCICIESQWTKNSKPLFYKGHMIYYRDRIKIQLLAINE